MISWALAWAAVKMNDSALMVFVSVTGLIDLAIVVIIAAAFN